MSANDLIAANEASKAALEDLSKRIPQIQNDFNDAIADLKKCFEENGEGCGEHADEVEEIVQEFKKVVDGISEPCDEVVAQQKQLISDMDEWLKTQVKAE